MVSNEVNKYIKKYKKVLDGKSGKKDLIPVLQQVQLKEGYLPQHAMIAVSETLEIPVSHVYGVATFYNFFKLEKSGKYVISLCEGTACHVKGAEELLDKIKEKLGIGPNEITEDGKFSLELVRCVGLCAFAPVMMINDKNFTQLDSEKVENIIESYKNGEES